MGLICVRCAAQGDFRIRAVSVAGGDALCGLHLWGHLYGGRPYSGQFARTS